MVAITDSLSRLENEHQDILDQLHEIRLQAEVDEADLEIIDRIEAIVEDWDRIFGGDVASAAIGTKLDDVRGSSEKREKLMELDLLIDPLRHYVIALEKYQLKEHRETVTRSAMVIERIVRELAIELGIDIHDKKMEDSFGAIQRGLEASGIGRGKEFVAEMRAIYSIRNDRGPHDVPAAALIQAKRSLAMLMWIYYRYLEIVSQIGSTDLPENDVENFTDLLDIILEFNPRLVMGEGGREPTVKDLLVHDLYRNGFFQTGKSLDDVMEELSSKRYNPNRSTVSTNLSRLTEEILSRKGGRMDSRYVEKIPPNEYFR